jgi:hypothetical protein
MARSLEKFDEFPGAVGRRLGSTTAAAGRRLGATTGAAARRPRPSFGARLASVLSIALLANCAALEQARLDLPPGDGVEFIAALAAGPYRQGAFERELTALVPWLEAHSAFRAITPPPVIVPPTSAAHAWIARKLGGGANKPASVAFMIGVCDSGGRAPNVIVIAPDWQGALHPPAATPEIERGLLRMILLHELVHHAQATGAGCGADTCDWEKQANALQFALLRHDLPDASPALIAQAERSMLDAVADRDCPKHLSR